MNTDRTIQEIQSIVTRHEKLHNYLLQKKQGCIQIQEANTKKFKMLTLIVFTNTFNYSPIQTL